MSAACTMERGMKKHFISTVWRGLELASGVSRPTPAEGVAWTLSTGMEAA